MRDSKGRFIKGNLAYWKGKKFPDKYKKKLSFLHKKLYTEGAFIPSRKGMIAWNKGLSGFMAGEKNGNYKNGLSVEAQLPRKSTKYRNWRKAVFERDNYTCQGCGARSSKGHRVYLEADHIKEWVDYPELRYVVSNGQTLCRDKCHREKTRKYMSNKKFEICTSWDDGGLLDLKIATLLKKYNLSGVFYIIVDKVGQSDYLNWEQIKDLDKQGFEIGSHTMTHPSDLKTLYEEQLHYEIQNSKDMLETVLGHTISRFCYPRGRYDDRVKQFVREAGYIQARGTGTPGILVANDRMAIPGTIHIFQRKEYGEKSVLEFAKETIDRVKKEGGYVNIWGHSKEINRDGNWEVLEEILKYVKSK